MSLLSLPICQACEVVMLKVRDWFICPVCRGEDTHQWVEYRGIEDMQKYNNNLKFHKFVKGENVT